MYISNLISNMVNTMKAHGFNPTKLYLNDYIKQQVIKENFPDNYPTIYAIPDTIYGLQVIISKDILIGIE